MASEDEEKNEIRLYDSVEDNFTPNTTVLTKPDSSKRFKSTDDNDPDVLCGYGSWTPHWIQKAAKPKLFLFFYSMAGITEGAAGIYFVGCMSTMEKRFSYDTKMSSLVLITVDVSSVIFGVCIGYFGRLAHRPKLLTFGMLMGALGCFVIASPYFIYGSGKFNENLHYSESEISRGNTPFCDKESNDIGESCNFSMSVPVVTFFFIGNFFRSIAVVIFYTIGPPYVDDNIKKKNSPVYLGTIFASRLLGPAVGFLLSSLCLQFYEDPFYDPGFSPEDPRWIGAWWLGFVILGIMTTVFCLPMMLFPKRFPGIKLSLSLEENKSENIWEFFLKEVKDMGKAIKRLIKNPILMSHSLGSVLRLNGIAGYYMLLPKYMEMQFRQSASKASLLSGPASIFGMQVGILIGGIVIRKFRPRPRLLTGGLVIVESFSLISLTVCMLITCPHDQMTGTSTVESTLFNLQNECNVHCKCTTEVYTPICGPDGKSTYFSPCYAGCTGLNKTDKSEVFTDCKCVHDEEGKFTTGDANKSYCGFECQWILTFVIILTLGKLLSSTARVGNALITLRCVDPTDKSVALGASSGIFSLLGFIPHPLIYGALTDSSCLIWEESCGRTGNCWVYDTDKLRYLLHGVSITFVFLGCLTDILVWILSPRLRNLYDDDDDDNDDKGKNTKYIGEAGVNKSSDI